MGTRIKIDGVGTVEVDDSFTQLSPEEQQRTVEEIASSAPKASGASTAPAPTQAPAPAPAPAAPRSKGTHTAEALRAFVEQRYPHAKFESGYRTPEHNREVGGVPNSYHVDDQAVDFTGLSEAERNRLYTDLKNAGVNPREFKFHDAGSGLHLHIAADSLPEGFGAPPAAPAAPGAQAPAAPAHTPERTAEILQAQTEATKLLQAGKEDEALALLGQHGLSVQPEELAAFHHGKRSNAFGKGVPTEGGKQGGLRHDLDYYGDQIRRGAGDLIDAPANIADLVYKGGQAIGRVATGGPIIGEVEDLPLPEWARPGQKLNEAQDDAEREQLGYLPEAANGPQRYAGASVRLLSGAASPAAKLAGLGKARAALATLTGAATGGVTGEASADVAPTLGIDPDKARFFGQVAGSVAGGAPVAAKTINEARFVKKRINDPRTPFLAKAVEKMDNVAKAHAPNGVTPKGRGPVSVEQINSIGKEFLNEVEPRLADMDLDPVHKSQLRAAIKRRADITPDEISALEGTPAGDAVAEGIRMFQATRDLTPGYNGYKPGPIRRAFEMGASVAGAAHFGPFGALVGPIIRRVIRGDPADLNMSRLDAGAKALKRKDAWAKLGQQTGADAVGTKTADFIKAHEDQVAATKAKADAAAQAKSNQAQAKQDAATQRTKERADKQAQTAADAKAKADAKAARYGMSDKEFANYTARSNSAKISLFGNEPAPRKAAVQKALTKYQSAIDDSSSKLDQFDPDTPKPETPTKAPKRSAYDLAAEQNIAQGIHGNHNAYADALGVKRSDVLAAVRQIKTDDISPFALRKLEFGYKLSPAERTQLIPRLQQKLTENGVIEFRAKEAASPEPVRKTSQTSDKPKSAAPVEAAPQATNFDQTAPAAEAQPSTGDYRPVKRREPWQAAKARNQADFDAERSKLSHEDSPHSREIVDAASDGLDHIRDKEKTVESALRYFDEDLGPHLRKEGFLPEEIDDFKRDVERIAKAGKTYKTDAEFERGAKVGNRGRPRKQPASDDVPF